MTDLSSGAAWLVLIAAGMCEIFWAAALAARNTRLIWRIVFYFLGSLLSLGGLAWALTAIDVTTAYAVWVGVGALTAIVYSVVRGRERLSVLRCLFIACLLGGAVGLKAVG
ncbi:SMR family transporter [Brevibacterium sp. 50QC2O2]|uniref:DMT family transporter n=1 Tax=Brevibacterium sp. 50QC2O2 TaxID=2968459 RepID=UPI00211B9A74|nr:SMR family transporter [Brevibacterium sp. 50QC2O2]MCQ9387491.1 SMR family transporter [Brevibacterium sp. 50QC2O2]